MASLRAEAVQRVGDPLPKIIPLPGFLRVEYIRCGQAACRCARGAAHGPYWYRCWREDGRQRKRYVRAADLERVRAALAEWRCLHPPAYAMRRQLAELRRLLRMFDRPEV